MQVSLFLFYHTYNGCTRQFLCAGSAKSRKTRLAPSTETSAIHMAVLLGGRPRTSHFIEKYFLVYSKLQSRKNHNTAILYLQTLHPRTRRAGAGQSPP